MQAQREMAEFNAMQMEPWDGPAMVGFTDGHIVGATLDRNGLRPARYCITGDGRLVLGSEAGTVLGIDDADIIAKGKLQPGRMLLLDVNQGRVVADGELKAAMSAAHPYGEWLANRSVSLAEWVEAARLNTSGHRRGGAERPSRRGGGVGSGGAPSSSSSSSSSSSPDAAVNRFELHAKPGSEFWAGRYAGEEAGSAVDLALAKARSTRRSLMQNGFTAEDMTMLLGPMSTTGKDVLGSMGNDAPLAVLSRQPRSVYDYFKQLFAQVTNPPIDPIRERLVMSLRCPVGPEGNLLSAGPDNCGRLVLPHPVLLPEELTVMRDTVYGPFQSEVLDITFDASNAHASDFKRTVQELCLRASALARQGQPVLVLSDRAAGADRLAVPSLLAVAAVHNHLVKTLQRTSVALVVDSGDAREVHHFCCLLGFGADAICPHQAFDALDLMNQDGLVRNAAKKGITTEELHLNYQDSIGAGIMKVMSKMGISTVQSYKGAQVFEAVGLADDIIDSCFPGTASRISGTRFEALFADILRLHDKAWSDPDTAPLLPSGGQFHVRDGGEVHFNGAGPMANLQAAVRAAAQSDDARAAYADYAEATDALSAGTTLRGVMRFVGAAERAERGLEEAALPVPLDEVESVADIVKRFNTGAMSLGSISQETHETLAVAMNSIGGRSNTGEGGEDVARFDDERRSAIKQVASGRFGVTSNYLANADQLQIKVAQGAKPGEGGELPGNKVTDYIGATRRTVPGVGLISPPPHHDIYSIEDLAQLIHDLKCANTRADISVKLVSSAGVGVVAAGVAKAKADHITISGHDGGTGAAAWTGIKHCGVPWELGIADAQQTLVLNGLRGRVTLQADGQMKTGRDVVIAALLGAEEVGFSTAPLIALGCVMMRKCHLNTCPVGIATQDPELRAKFAGQPEHAVNFFWMLAEEVRAYMAELGVRKFDDLVGRSDWLEVDQAKLHYKSEGLNLENLLMPAHALEGGVGGVENYAVRKLTEQVRRSSGKAMPC